MSEDNNFVSSFISECVLNGKSSVREICKEAVEQIFQCDDQLSKMDSIRRRKDQLQTVLTKFNFDEIKKKQMMAKSLEGIDDLKIKICKYLTDNKSVKTSDIIEAHGGYMHQAEIYAAIKNLGELDIIKRDDEGFVIEGNGWETRPL